MIVADDIVVAYGDVFHFSDFDSLLLKNTWCVNLECAVAANNTLLPFFGDYNSDPWLSSFKSFQIGPFFLEQSRR